ncbi:MAG: hypothetical protein B7Z66_11525 [Chromatiales bacterium 21-64-14]|nr:MAG: hypothetical protein B7Z66_11525 [Chromatiales bacterium 21-64-14]
MYVFNDKLDQWILKPISDTYVKITPKPVRTSVTNFFNNVEYLNTALNQFLQGKVEDGFKDTGRFLVNSTAGIGGLFDVATGLGLKYHQEDLGQTLAVWGVGQGPYLVLPFIGPDTLRNLPNLVMSSLTDPLFYVSNPAITMPIGALGLVDKRANEAAEIRFVHESAVDPYIFVREAYLQHRRFLIYNGHPPPQIYDNLGAGGLVPPPAAAPPTSGKPTSAPPPAPGTTVPAPSH